VHVQGVAFDKFKGTVGQRHGTRTRRNPGAAKEIGVVPPKHEMKKTYGEIEGMGIAI